MKTHELVLLAGVLGIFLFFLGCNSGQSQLEKEMEEAKHATLRDDFILKSKTYFREWVELRWDSWTYGAAVDYEGLKKSLKDSDWGGMFKNLFPVNNNDMNYWQKLSVAHSGGYIENFLGKERIMKMVVATTSDSISKDPPGTKKKQWSSHEKVKTTHVVVLWSKVREPDPDPNKPPDPEIWNIYFQVYSADFSLVYLKKKKDSQYTWNLHFMVWENYLFYFIIKDWFGWDVTEPTKPVESLPKETIFFTPSSLEQVRYLYDTLVRVVADEVYGPTTSHSTTIMGL